MTVPRRMGRPSQGGHRSGRTHGRRAGLPGQRTAPLLLHHSDSQRTDRHVEPYRLVCLGRRWYLVAYDLTRLDWRSFRVDRLTAPHGTGSPFRLRDLPAADAAEFVRTGLDNVPRPYQVKACRRAQVSPCSGSAVTVARASESLSVWWQAARC